MTRGCAAFPGVHFQGIWQAMSVPEREVRAYFTPAAVRVYQAYSDPIADGALARQTFLSPSFSMTRMTWIKPSFLWMMYRSGWGLKDPGAAANSRDRHQPRRLCLGPGQRLPQPS